MPRVLVLLATFNGAAHVERQIRSLAEQTGANVTVVASDDGSNDGTVQLAIKAAEREGLRLDFLPQPEHPSGSAARNFFRLISLADFVGYDFVALCDQDDIWMPQKLCRAIGEMERENAGAYSSNSIAWWQDGRQKIIRKDFTQQPWDHVFESASHGCTYVIRAGLAVRFARHLRSHPPGLEAIQFHDWLLYAWARSLGERWLMDNAHLLRYRQSDVNVIGANAGLRAALTRGRKLRRGWLRSQALAVLQAGNIDDFPFTPQLSRFNWKDRATLAWHARQFRRRPRDAFAFAIACLTIGI